MNTDWTLLARLCKSVVVVVLVAGGLFTLPAANAPEQEVVRGVDQFDFTYRVKLPAITQPGHLWLPLAKSDAFQTIVAKNISAPGEWRQVRDRDHDNLILVMRPQPADSGKVIEVKYVVRRREKASYASPEKDALHHLKPERLVPVNQTFKSLAKDITRDQTTALACGRALYDHVLRRMKYDKSGEGWGRGDATYACDSRAGNCTDFHAYFIALARSLGLPARFAIGYTIPADKDAGVIAGYHCWAEFFADGKWVPVDISEASKSPALAGYYFGHHPANRFELSAGRDLIVEPVPAASPINFLVYPLLEVDGKAVRTENEFRFRRTKG